MTEYNVHRIRFIEYVPKSINCAAHDKVNNRVALSREDGSIEIRDPTCDWVIDRIIPGQDGRTVENLVWNRSRLFSSGMSGDIIEWDLETLQPRYTQDSYGGPVWCVKFSHSKKQLAAGCEDGSIRLFDVLDDGIVYVRCLTKQKNRILSLSWSFDDLSIVSGGCDCKMHVVNVKSGRVIASMTVDNLKSGETMIWTVNFLKDSTIVCGDSLGNTQFWNNGVLTQSFNTHLADVLSIAVSDDQQTIFSSGVDSKVVMFSLVRDEKSRWTPVKHVRATSHDTRTLTMCGKYLLSGGIDPRFIVYPIDNFSSQSFVRYSCLPSSDVCMLARDRDVIAFREQSKVHIWNMKQNDKPKKIYEINSNGVDHLVSATLSRKATYLAYSSLEKAKVLMLESCEKPSLQKLEMKIDPATQMIFSNDEKQLIIATSKEVKMYDMETISFNVLPCKNVCLPFRNLCISDNDQYICATDTKTCHIFTAEKFLCSLPKLDGRIISVRFHPETCNLFVSTSSKSVYEFNIDTETLVPYMTSLNETALLKKMGFEKDKINGIAFSPADHQHMFLQTKEVLSKIVYGKDFTAIAAEKESRKRKQNDDFKMVRKFTNMMFFDFNSAGDIVIVERPFANILELLPDPLYVKKFGS